MRANQEVTEKLSRVRVVHEVEFGLSALTASTLLSYIDGII